MRNSDSKQTTTSDDALLKALREAAANRAEPDRVEALIGLPALLNTRRPPGREALRIADIAPDPDYQTSLPDLVAAADVVYWDHGWTRAVVRIAGLVWHQDGRSEVFCGMIYPP